MKCLVDRNMVIGETRLPKLDRYRMNPRGPLPQPSNISGDMINMRHPMGSGNYEEFFDSGHDQLLTCHAMLDQIALHDKSYIKLVIDKVFLKKILNSHIHFVRKISIAD